MDFHPLIVHFPIALLVVYSLLELVRMRRLEEQEWWLMVKTVFLVIGTLGAGMALMTGDVAAELNGREGPLLQLHEWFAQASSFVFGILTVHYLIASARRLSIHEKFRKEAYPLFARVYAVNEQLFRPWLTVLLAVAGLIGMSIVGALGGALVYGPNADPIVSFVYNLFLK